MKTLFNTKRLSYLSTDTFEPELALLTALLLPELVARRMAGSDTPHLVGCGAEHIPHTSLLTLH